MVFLHISNIPLRISWNQICYNTPMFYEAAIFVNVAIQPAVGCSDSWAITCFWGCSLLGEKELWNRTIVVRFSSVLWILNEQDKKTYQNSSDQWWLMTSAFNLKTHTCTSKTKLDQSQQKNIHLLDPSHRRAVLGIPSCSFRRGTFFRATTSPLWNRKFHIFLGWWRW